MKGSLPVARRLSDAKKRLDRSVDAAFERLEQHNEARSEQIRKEAAADVNTHLGAPILAVDDKGLSLPIVSLTNVDGRSVRLAGVCHVADEGYWEQWRVEFVDLISRGVDIQMEMVRSSRDPQPVPGPVGQRYRRLVATWVDHQGLALQSKIVKPLLADMQVTDMSLEDLKERLGADTKAILAMSLIAYPVASAFIGLSRDAFVDLFARALRQERAEIVEHDRLVASGENPSPRSARRRRRHRVVVEERNAIAIEAIDAAADQTLAVWGAAHLEGILDALVARGWAVTGAEWRLAIARSRAGSD